MSKTVAKEVELLLNCKSPTVQMLVFSNVTVQQGIIPVELVVSWSLKKHLYTFNS